MVFNPLCKPIAVHTTKTTAGFFNQPAFGKPNQQFTGVCTKLLLIMKFTAILLFAAAMQVSARGFSQQINLSVKNASLGKVFTEIKKQTGYNFVYASDVLQNSKKISVEFKGITVEEALQIIFKDQPLSYSVVDKVVVVKVKEAIPNEQPTVTNTPPATILITFKVSDGEGNPLAGATVIIRNTKKGGVTNAEGVVSLNVSVGDVLSISFVGFETQSLTITSQNSTLNVVLKRNDSSLDEVQVIAYGTTTKRLNTGNISSVKGEDIGKQPVNNPLLALQGRVPGLFITQTSGISGSGVNVQLQGKNSIQNGSDPFYVIDGVPYISQTLPTTLQGGSPFLESSPGGGRGNPFSFINPSDIESIEILKDADATSIYGSRAANGAILITTKKGKAGAIKVDINLQQGWGKTGRKMDVMNTSQYLQMRKEALKNDNIPFPSIAVSPTNTLYDLNGLWDTTRYTDWQNVLIGGTAQYSNVNVSISGGTAMTQYLISGTYYRETTVFPGNFSDRKGSLHFNLNTRSTNQKLKFQLTASYMADDNRLPGQDLTRQAISLIPNAPELYNSDGTLNWQLTPTGNVSWQNPLSYLYQVYTNNTNNLIGNINLSYELFSGFTLRANGGYVNQQSNELSLSGLLFTDPVSRAAYGDNNARGASYSFNNIHSWILEPMADYKLNFGENHLTVLIGSTIQEENSKGLNLITGGFASDAQLSDFHSATTIYANSTAAAKYRSNSGFARFNYNWGNKYILNLNARRDGSSRFGPANQYHTFASAGIAWIFTEEPAVKDKIPSLSFGKLRASYGITGNDQIGDYQFLNLYASNNGGVPFQGSSALITTGLPNPYLEWEETRKLQAGIELGFLNNRIFVNVNYVLNRSSNQLLQTQLSTVTGFSGVLTNLAGTVQNTAEEVQISTVNIKTKTFNWSSNFNITLPQNKLVSYPGDVPRNLIIGEPINFRRRYHYLGVNPATGIYQFADSHGNPTSNPNANTDKTEILNITFPEYYGGFQNSFQYKGISLDVFIQFVKKLGENYLFGPGPAPGRKIGNSGNQPVYVLERWQKPGDITTIQRFASNSIAAINIAQAAVRDSDAFWTDASYVRLKNVSLSYQFDNKLIKKLKMQNLRIYIQGQNLLTVTRFKGLDPETGNYSLPPLKLVTVGVQTTF